MKIRIEVEWADLVNIVGHGKARGLCRKAQAQIVEEDEANLIPPWEKAHWDKRYGRLYG